MKNKKEYIANKMKLIDYGKKVNIIVKPAPPKVTPSNKRRVG